ncbi:MAG: hypothetical protein K2X99_01100 [Gemmatimonadaceae bacterium]|nr:hypothetical protein [Gemmatimonadaceae bacterium]
MMRALRVGLLVTGAALSAQGTPRAAVRTCVLEFDNTDTSRVNLTKLPSGQYRSYFGAGVKGRCKGSDQRLVSDSAEHDGESKVLLLIGNVHYTEARVKVDAARMTYYTAEERLYAEGDVVAVTPAGTRLMGPSAEYLRAVPGMRTIPVLSSDKRPRVRLSPADAKNATDDAPVDLVATRLRAEGDSLMYASGDVVMARPDIEATADSAFLDNGREIARLMRTPVVRGIGARKFELEGGVIDLYSRQRALQRVVARGTARAKNDDLDLTADTIDLRVTGDKLSRAIAWGATPARAHSPARDITADSIDIDMPGQRLRELHAVRHAAAETDADSMKLKTTERDWLRGDTIVARFDTTAAPSDSAGQPALREIVASGAARSFYQVASRVSRTALPNINYVTGKGITVRFDSGEVRHVAVREQANGVYLEATPDSVRADSAAAKPAARRAGNKRAVPKPGARP